MKENLKVTVLKKSKDAPYPEHIIVERRATHEIVHLYFDDGNLAKLTHIVRDSQTRTDLEDKGQQSSLPNYIIFQEAIYKENGNNHLRKSTYLKGPKDQNFFSFAVQPIWNQSTIGFKSFPGTSPNFFVEMDLNDKCIPNAYIHGNVEVSEIYPRKTRRTCLNYKNFKEHARD